VYLIDGNNVMGQTPGWHRDLDKSRRRLVRELVDFAAATHARVTVVFDGEPSEGLPHGMVTRGVRVLFAGRTSDADAVVLGLARRCRGGGALQVVTSDRELARACQQAGAAVVRSGHFRRFMAELRGCQEAADPGDEVRPDTGSLEYWMDYFGRREPD
jgi:predicted RNA-binding protein with PIN domain